MNKFCKLFETEEYGQLLVLFDTNEECKPSVKILFTTNGLGVCSVGPTFEDTEEGWSEAEDLFERLDEDVATNMIRVLVAQLMTCTD